MGDKEGDRFGSSNSTDKSGNFVVVGSERGGYVRTMMNLQKDDNNQTALWKATGNNTIEAVSCSSVFVGRLSLGSCRRCENTINGTHIVAASDGKAHVYQFFEARDEGLQLGDIIAAGDSCANILVRVAMPPNCQEIAVTCPYNFPDKMRGRVSIYNIINRVVV
jgi:hypothetical protein